MSWIHLCEAVWMIVLLPRKYFIPPWAVFTFVRLCGWLPCWLANTSYRREPDSPLWGSVDNCLAALHILLTAVSRIHLYEAVWMIALLPRKYFNRREPDSPLWGSVDDCLVASQILHTAVSRIHLCEAVWMIALLPRIYFIWIWGFTPCR